MWGRDVAVEYPARVLRLIPRERTLHEGVLASARRPPATNRAKSYISRTVAHPPLHEL